MEARRSALTQADLCALEETLFAWRKKPVSWLMDAFGDIPFCLASLKKAGEEGRVIRFLEEGTFRGLLLFDIGRPWWTPHTVCAEELVLAVRGARGIQRAAIQALEDIAALYGAKLIVAGNIFQENNHLIGNGYKKHAFRQACATYVKEVEEP